MARRPHPLSHPPAPAVAGLLALAGLVVPGLAEAQSPRAPDVAVIGFRDLPDGQHCDRVEARYGRCIEEVRFIGKEHVYTSFRTSDRAAHARLHSMSRLYGWMWDDLAFRWKGDELLEDTMHEAGLSRLPTTAQQWGATPAADDTFIHAVPDEARWIWRGDWLSRTSQDVVYPEVRYHKPAGLVRPPSVAVMRGRFAERLVVDGRRHPFEIMDGDLESSGPFFEQMYPYDRALLSGRAGDDDGRQQQVPLRSFVADERLKGDDSDAGVGPRSPEEWERVRREAYEDVLLPSTAGLDDFRERARDEFENFYDTIGIQILQFAREEYTPTHLRVITSLMAMNSPPGQTAALGLDREGNPGGIGMTDDPSVYVTDDAPGFAFDQYFSLNYGELPSVIIERRLPEFSEWRDEDPDFLHAYTDRVWIQLQDFLRPDMRPITRLDDQSLLADWANENARSGQSSIIRAQLKQIALELIVTGRPEDERDEIETSLLLDHVLTEVVSRFPGGADDEPFTPLGLQDIAADRWESVLETHGFYTTDIPDGPGVVNPLAVCSTRSGTAALEEPSFGMVKVDGLVVAPVGLDNPDEVVWAARDQLPFIMVDNPVDNRPEVTRLVNLPGERSVYRIRWEVWSGWHLTWAAEPVDRAREARRLALRTGAFCEDMVLAPPSLVPTLVRASLLDGDFRPPTMARARHRRAHEELDTLAVEADLLHRLRYPDEPALEIVEVDDDDADELDELMEVGAAGLLGPDAPDVDAIPSETVAYFRTLVDDVLASRSAERPSMFVVFDQSATHPSERVRWAMPRRPYATERARSGRGERVYTSSWAYFRDTETPVDERHLVFPAYQPTESVNTDALVQRWRRRSSGDWTGFVGLGMFPLRASTTSCATGADAGGSHSAVVAPCGPEDTHVAQTEGFHADLGFMRTIWLSDRPRWAVEFGPHIRTELLHAGESWFYDSRTHFLWTPRIQFGMIGGLRFAPIAGRLSVRPANHPWGADRPDGTSTVGRTQFGFRAGALMGPGPTGAEITGVTEGWMAWSIPRMRSRSATFQPYHPDLMVGPYVAGTGTWALSEGDYLKVDSIYSMHVGFRLQMGVGQGAKEMGEGL